MPHAVTMPKLGMSMEQGTVLEWRMAPGQPVEKGAILLVIESEKAQVEIEATASGVLRHVYVAPEETVPCGTLLAALTDAADDPFDAEAFRAQEERAHPPPPPAPPIATAAPAPAPAAPRTGAPTTPAARRRARERDVDVARVPGTGPGGRVTAEDVETFAATRANLTPVAEGVALEVLADGAGDLVALLPGFGTDVSAFARQAPVLAERYRVLGINPRGVGLSDAPEEDLYTLAVAANDAAAVLDGPAHVVGASLGAAVAIELALTHPDCVRSLTLITPVVRANARLLAVCDAWRDLVRQANAVTAARAMLPWFFSDATLGVAALRDRLVRGLAQTIGRVPVATLERTLAGLRAWSGTRDGDLAQITAPTLVIAAEADLLTPDGEAIAATIPHAHCVVVPGAGHAVALEAPEAVNGAIIEHVQACP